MKTKSVLLYVFASLVMGLALMLSAGEAASHPVSPGSQALAQATTAPTTPGNGNGNGNGNGGGGDKITICHIPPGNTGNPQTITISRSAWKVDGKGEGGHGPGLHGGDYEGPCRTGTEAASAAGTMSAQTCSGWVLYHSDRTGNLNIFRLDLASGAAVDTLNVSKGKGSGVQDISPAHSSDGAFVAFSSNRDGHGEIYAGAADGSLQERMTNSKGDNVAPMFSPDDKSIAFESTRNGNRDIYMIDPSNKQETQLTDDKADDGNPYWSPDSAKILFQSHRDGFWQIYELTLNGKAVKRLSDGNSNDVNPQYSPDGKQIVFRSYPKTGSPTAVIYVMNADGSNRVAVSDSKGDALNPAWSPDNKLIAYQSNLKGAGDIFVYQLSDKATRQVTDSSTRSSAPTWTCDGSALVYTAVVTGRPQLFQTAALPIDAKPVKPSDATQLTSDNATNQNPENSPAVEDASYRSQHSGAQ